MAEVFSARKAALRITTEGARQLKEILTYIAAHLSEPSCLSEADYRLHEAIAQLAGNVIIRLLFNSFKPIYHYYTDVFYALPNAAEDSLAFHRKVVDAIIEGDSDLAGSTMDRALDYAQSRVQKALGLAVG